MRGASSPGLATLTRSCLTTAGLVSVAGIGSVVTREDRRGQGYSSALQQQVVERLAAEGVHLAVLWTDQPEIYAGRGFQAAGWEYHLDLSDLRVDELWPAGADRHTLTGTHAPQIARHYEQHPLRTLRPADDHQRLYGMPGTRVVGLVEAGRVVAYACCGKGEDFPDYVAEWGGAPDRVLAVMARAAADGLASRALIPAGREEILERAVCQGCGFAAVPSGLWAVLRPDLLAELVGPVTDGREHDPRAWLGHLEADGTPVPGRLQLGIWGLDSV